MLTTCYCRLVTLKRTAFKEACVHARVQYLHDVRLVGLCRWRADNVRNIENTDIDTATTLTDSDKRN